MTRVWDVIIVGAGPAGAAAAIRLADTGRSTLLVDRSRFPRDKVCGGCLGAPAVGLLRELGVEPRPVTETDSLRLHAGAGLVNVPLPRGWAVSRRDLDAAMVTRAVNAGAEFRDGIAARLGPVSDGVRVVDLGGERAVARTVLVAHGVSGRSLPGARIASAVPDGWMGAGLHVERTGLDWRDGTITMMVGRRGYVGAVALGDRIMVGACLDPQIVRAAGGVGPLAGAIVDPVHPRLADRLRAPGGWRGTPRLTRRAPDVAPPCTLLLGDAAGYVEPFTGEGMGWALRDGVDAATMLQDGWHDAIADRWRRRFRDEVAARQRTCRWLREILHRHWLLTGVVRAAAVAPILARPVVRRVFGHAVVG